MTEFIISKACCGDSKVEIVVANSKVDIAYEYIMKAYMNSYWCSGYGLEVMKIYTQDL